MKFLFVTDESLSADLAWQLKKEGHDVKMYCRSPGEKDVGLGFFEKVDEWEPFKDWADVVIFDDIGFGSKAEQLRKEGKFVVGGSFYTDKLELDREFGQSELNSVGVDILPRWNFTSFDESIKFVRENPDRYVLKPSVKAQNEKELLFIGQEPDGKDVVLVLEHYKANWSKKIKEFLIQKYAEGVEIAVGAFFNGKEFILPVCVNFEHKRLFPAELGPSTGEMGTLTLYSRESPVFERTLLRTKEKLVASGYVGYIDINCIANGRGIWPLEWTCFDEITEILTKDGWKSYNQVEAGDWTLAVNPKTKEIAWKRITSKLVKSYRGKMISIGAREKKHSAIDVLVTPDHELLVTTSGRLRAVRADSIPVHETKLVRTGTFRGSSAQFVTIPEYLSEYKHTNGTILRIVMPAVLVGVESFLKFLGMFLAGGYTTGNFVKIYQSLDNPNRKEIENILDDFPFKHTTQMDGFQISSGQLCNYLRKLGLEGINAPQKFIPSEFKELEPRYLEALIDAFALGDGHHHKRTKQLYLLTSSSRLADDLQEIIIKTGKVANMRIQKQKGTLSIGGYVREYDMHVLSIRKIKRDYSLDSRVISKVDYDGLVWDVEVEDWHSMLVRRCGKPFFSLNCRFGYPTISIQMEGITSEWGTFLSELAQGKDAQLRAKKGYQVGVVVTIPPWPFQDDRAFKKYSEGATILFRRQNLDGVHIGEVKLEEGDWHIAGNSGYALIITGSGATMADAIEKAYQNVSNVMIPNMFYRNDIGARWARDSDKLLSWGYL
jgi:phosphoribosylamine-glycine ligase